MNVFQRADMKDGIIRIIIVTQSLAPDVECKTIKIKVWRYFELLIRLRSHWPGNGLLYYTNTVLVRRHGYGVFSLWVFTNKWQKISDRMNEQMDEWLKTSDRMNECHICGPWVCMCVYYTLVAGRLNRFCSAPPRYIPYWIASHIGYIPLMPLEYFHPLMGLSHNALI